MERGELLPSFHAAACGLYSRRPMAYAKRPGNTNAFIMPYGFRRMKRILDMECDLEEAPGNVEADALMAKLHLN